MTRRILTELAAERASHGHGEAARIDRRMGRAKGYLGRILREELRLDVLTLFEALEALDADPADFFARAVGTRFRPVNLLTRLERRAADEGPSVLDRFELRIAGDEVEAVVEPAGKASPLDAVARQLDRLEEWAFTDPDGALAAAEGSLLAGVWHLGSGSGDPSREVACRALGVVAAIYRRKARFGVAARCLRMGFELSKARELLAVRAELLQRACYLVGDQGEYEAALGLAREASDAYLLLGDEVGVGKALVDRAVMLTALGKLREAIAAYERSLSYLPEALWYSRCAAHQGLGFGFLYSGDLDSAADHTATAAETHRTRRGPNWARLVWLRGEIALKMNEPAAAEKFLRAALHALGDSPNHFDVAIVSLRLAQALLLDRRMAEVEALAADLMGLLHPLRRHRIASAALAEVTRAALTGELTLDLLDEVCLDLQRETGRPIEGRPPGLH